ncbi:hypothetical protein GCM10023149_27610 [Mucilaginibacter gynuensis]|uniref:Acyl carrier protein n=1 Tax=Mucilaginibacter gynuensis TaxID=1302236 RepID=A0ABP8GJQ8_9SPHI
MNNNQLFLLKNVDPDDFGRVLLKVERSFGIKFCQDDLGSVRTFGNLCDVIHNKIKQEHSDTCTTQQAFYKLRNAIMAATGLDRGDITIQTSLKDIFPENERLQLIGTIEADMGLSLNVLQPKQTTIYALACIFALSIAALFFNMLIAAGLMLVFAVGAFMAGKFGKELRINTLGQLAEKIAREHFLKCKRETASVNRKEINHKMQQLFADDLYVDASVLTADARF